MLFPFSYKTIWPTVFSYLRRWQQASVYLTVSPYWMYVVQCSGSSGYKVTFIFICNVILYLAFTVVRTNHIRVHASLCAGIANLHFARLCISHVFYAARDKYETGTTYSLIRWERNWTLKQYSSNTFSQNQVKSVVFWKLYACSWMFSIVDFG